MLTKHPHAMLNLQPPSPHMPSWYAQGQLYCNLRYCQLNMKQKQIVFSVLAFYVSNAIMRAVIHYQG
jgi:hypothetical protein